MLVLLLSACAPSASDPSVDGPAPDDAADTADDADDADAVAPEAPATTEANQDGAPDPGPTVSVSGELEVHYLDVGQGDATLLVHDEVAVLIDAGRWQASDVVTHLHARGVDALDLVVITHPHADHVGQFDQVLEAFPVAEVWWSGSETTTQTFERALSALEGSEALYEEPRAGDSTQVGPLTIDVVNPPTGVNLSDLHDAGLGLRVTYGEMRFLFTGDSKASTESRMVADSGTTLAADVLQLGHHGSTTSTTDAFLSAVGPSVAIYSVGADNQYGHPHVEVIDRLDAEGVSIYGTDAHGSVVVATDGTDLRISTEQDGAVAAAPAPGGGDNGSDAEDADEGGTAPPGGGDAEEGGADPVGGHRSGCTTGQVDINSAGIDELQQIIHIGPARARDLVDLRPFPSVAGLDRVSGIGAARLDDIVDQGVACAG